jgi:hypothetical protein
MMRDAAARKEWGVPLVRNPLEAVSKPPAARSRTRRLTDADATKLAEGLLKTRNNQRLRHRK